MLQLIPSRQTRPHQDVIFSLNAEAISRQQAGESIINGTIGMLMGDDGTLALMETVSMVLRNIPPPEWAAYAPIPGMPDFLEAVLMDTLSTQAALAATAVVVATPGGTGALRHAIVNYLETGQSLLTSSYFWSPYHTVADEHERHVETFPMFTATREFNVDALDAKLRELVKRQGRVLLFLNDPCHNPTGYSMTTAEWRAVVTTLLKYANHPITLLIDMAYRLYAVGDGRAFLAELLPLLGRVGLLFAWSASKSYTQYGLRTGALIACEADEKARRATQAALEYSGRGVWSNCVRGGQVALAKLLGEAPLKDSCETERGVLKKLLLRRVHAFNVAAQAKGLQYPRYEGGFFVTLFDENPEGKAQSMRARGVYVVPQNGALRVALCSVATQDVPRLVAALAD